MNSTKSSYKQLYLYNQMPESRHKQYIEQVSKSDKSKLLFINSGFHCIENEIAEFANKHALYNKCEKAKDYLTSALNVTNEKIQEYEEKLDTDRQSIQSQMDKKQSVLLNELNKKSTQLADDYNIQYRDKMSAFINENYNPDNESKKIEKTWEQYKKNSDKIEQMRKEVDRLFNGFLTVFCGKAEELSKEFWKEKQEIYKRVCGKLISESTSFTQDQKKLLEQHVLNIELEPVTYRNFDIRTIGAVVPHKFLFLKWGEKFVLKDCKKLYNEELKINLTNLNEMNVNDARSTFEKWADNLIITLQQQMISFNPKLSNMKENLEKCNKKIKALNDQKKFIIDSQRKIEKLMTYKEVNNG